METRKRAHETDWSGQISRKRTIGDGRAPLMQHFVGGVTVNSDSPDVYCIFDRRIKMTSFQSDMSLYSLLRFWVHDDPNRKVKDFAHSLALDQLKNQRTTPWRQVSAIRYLQHREHMESKGIPPFESMDRILKDSSERGIPALAEKLTNENNAIIMAIVMLLIAGRKAKMACMFLSKAPN
eukprot:gene6674-13519_t